MFRALLDENFLLRHAFFAFFKTGFQMNFLPFSFILSFVLHFESCLFINLLHLIFFIDKCHILVFLCYFLDLRIHFDPIDCSSIWFDQNWCMPVASSSGPEPANPDAGVHEAAILHRRAPAIPNGIDETSSDSAGDQRVQNPPGHCRGLMAPFQPRQFAAGETCAC